MYFDRVYIYTIIQGNEQQRATQYKATATITSTIDKKRGQTSTQTKTQLLNSSTISKAHIRNERNLTEKNVFFPADIQQ